MSTATEEMKKLIRRDTPDRTLQQTLLLRAIAIGVLELLEWKEGEA